MLDPHALMSRLINIMAAANPVAGAATAEAVEVVVTKVLVAEAAVAALMLIPAVEIAAPDRNVAET